MFRKTYKRRRGENSLAIPQARRPIAQIFVPIFVILPIRGVLSALAAQDLSVHQSQPRDWVNAFADDPYEEKTGATEACPPKVIK